MEHQNELKLNEECNKFVESLPTTNQWPHEIKNGVVHNEKKKVWYDHWMQSIRGTHDCTPQIQHKMQMTQAANEIIWILNGILFFFFF